MANRIVIIKQIEELIAEHERELDKTDKTNPVAVAHFKTQIRRLKQAKGLIK